MTFFEPPPPPPEEPAEPVAHPWLGPPNNVLGVTIPIDAVLARSQKAIVTLGSLVAYPEGFTLEYLILVRDPDAGEHLPELHRYAHRRSGGDELPDELFRFGIEFADGSRATTLDVRRAFTSSPDEIRGPILAPRGGGGSLDRWQGSYWVWPLPPDGPLAFVCEWPVAGIPLTRYELEAGCVREASARAELLWEGDAGSASAGHGSFMQQVMLRRATEREPPTRP
jgi:hypothetical protein